MHRLPKGLFLLALIGASPIAKAQQHDGQAGAEATTAGSSGRPILVRIALPECPAGPEPLQGFVAILRVELAVRGMSTELCESPSQCHATNGGSAVLGVELPECDFSGEAAHLWVQVHDGGTHQHSVFLGDAPPEARARTLALSASELVRDHLEPTDATHVRSEPGSPTQRPAAPTSFTDSSDELEPERARGLSLDLGLAFRLFPERSSTFLGPRATIGHLFADLSVEMRMDAGFMVGTGTDVLGEVTVLVGSAALGAHWVGHVSGATFTLGPRIEGGMVRGRGTANDPGTVSAQGTQAMVVAGLEVGTRIPFAGPWSASLGLSLGYALSGVDFSSEDRHTIGLVGSTLCIRLGLSHGP